jgi:2-aminoadipate transaminase
MERWYQIYHLCQVNFYVEVIVIMHWESLFNARAQKLQPSGIQEMMVYASRPGTISFAAGQPSEDLYPVEVIKQGFNEALNDMSVLAYPHTAGDPLLRKWVSDWMADEKLVLEAPGEDRILLTTGSQQGLNILSQLFLKDGDVVIVENPSYPEAMLTFEKEGARFLTVPIDEEGPDPMRLEKVLKKEKVAFFYTIPTFQNPSGASTSLKRKREILALLKKYGVTLVEDDPYRQLWFDSQPEATYLSIAEEDDPVIYLGSFSKIVAPGLRCGWMVLPPEVMEKAVQLRLTLELGSSALLQRIVFFVVSQPSFDEHLHSLRDEYKERRDAMAEAISKYLTPLGFSFSLPHGGFFFWGENKKIDGVAFARFAAKEHKVAVIPGEIFFAFPEEGKHFIRLSFAKVKAGEMSTGIERIAEAFREFC